MTLVIKENKEVSKDIQIRPAFFLDFFLPEQKRNAVLVSDNGITFGLLAVLSVTGC